MKKLLKKWIFIAQFHLQDPDPDSEYGSGSSSSLAILIRIHPDPDQVPDPQHCTGTNVGTNMYVRVSVTGHLPQHRLGGFRRGRTLP